MTNRGTCAICGRAMQVRADGRIRTHRDLADNRCLGGGQRPIWLAGPKTLREAWFEGYVAAERDADNRPYSDHPSAATWKPTSNPYRAGETINEWMTA